MRSKVQSQGENDGDAKALAAQVIIHATGGQVAAVGPSNKEWSVSYEVFVQRRTDLNLTANNGGIGIDHVRGNIELPTQNGGVHVELACTRWDGAGLDIKTRNGGVHSDFAELVGEKRQRQVSKDMNGGGAPAKDFLIRQCEK